MKLLLGTGNPAKLNHYKKYFEGTGVELVTPKDLGILGEPEETGATLEENAKIKAKFYFEQSGLPTLADDAGFEIPALNNWPGVKSHRINGKYDASDEEIIATVLKKMQGLNGEQRNARMKIVIALAIPGKEIITSYGQLSGTVPEKPFEKREAHFPYRSLLLIPKEGKWMLETNEDHRKTALEKLLPILENFKSFNF